MLVGKKWVVLQKCVLPWACQEPFPPKVSTRGVSYQSVHLVVPRTFSERLCCVPSPRSLLTMEGSLFNGCVFSRGA